MSEPANACFYFDYNQEVHGILLTIAWFVFANVGIWALFFKSYTYGIFVHIFCMCSGAFLMIVAPMIMIGCVGPPIILQTWYHQTIGFVFYCILPFMLVSGFVCKISKDKPETTPSQVYLRARGHAIFGWIYIFFTQVPMLAGWYGTELNNIIFGGVIIIDVISYSTYVALKFLKKRIEQESINQELTVKELRRIRSARDLRIYSENYFIFANYVYSLSKILSSHPGGWNIIQSIRRREVDRFLYGVDPIEMFDVPKISHSFNSINLAGPPMAVLQIPKTYPLEELNDVKISHIYCHDKNMTIHTVYLELGSQCKFKGYTEVSQIGQYYALTVNSKMTRLYTAVNFLQTSNITLINQISQGEVQISKNSYSANQIYMSNQEETLSKELDEFEKDHVHKNLLPLLIKKYGDGKFTSFFLSANNKFDSIKISHLRGLGLSLDCVTSKNIVIFAGGTGLYPYSDLIDLLFKAKVVEEGHKLTTTILESNSVLKKKPFEGINFTFYVAVNEISQLHPITLYEINYLSKSANCKFYAKIKGQNLQKLSQSYKNVGIVNDRFQKLVSKELGKDKSTVFYICGPVRFTRSLLVELQHQNVSPQNYKIV